MTAGRLSVWEMAAAKLEGTLRLAKDAATPGELAGILDPQTVQTPALELIDQRLVEASKPYGRLMVALAPQEGKALALDTPVATVDGWSTMGALRVGDQVFDRNGDPCAVTWLSPVWTDRPCYTVRAGDGEAIVADAAHEWIGKVSRNNPRERVHETTDLAIRRAKNFQITGPASLNLPDVDVPLDPYVLGVWLGDGHSLGARLTSHLDDVAVRDRLADAGWPVRKDQSKYGYSFAAAHEQGPKGSRFRQALKQLDLIQNKHIPTAYLRGSEKQRLALLQGLVDTDGYVDPRGQVEFCTMSRRIAEDVVHLVFSLGAKATLRTGRATLNGKDCGEKYRVRFFRKGAAHLPRKAERCADSSVARVRYVWAEESASVPVRCIEVDSADHTFLAGRTLLPTRNSTRCAMYFPLWLLMRNPDLRIAIASYESTIARRWGRAIRNLIISHPELGLKVKGDTAAAHEWALDGKHPKDSKGYESPHRGGLITAGLDAAITGRPVDVLIIDDPVKDRAQAESQVYRERAWDWWTDAARPRFGPGAIVVVVQTRWHEDDLTGRLQVRDADTWTVLNVPTQADHRPEKGETDPLGREPGEYMISARGNRMPDWLAQQKSPSTWAALYQGKPAPAEGTLLKRPYWVYYDTPKAIRQPDGTMLALGADEVIQSWDCAFKDTKASDYVVCQVWGRWGNDAYLLDQVHERLSFTGTVEAVKRVSKEWPQTRLKLVEDKANGTAVIDHLRREVTGLVPVQVRDGKYARAVAVSPFIESRHAFIPSENLSRWVQGFVDECATFPNSTNDDQVDAMTQALDRLLGHPVKVLVRRPPQQLNLPSGVGAALGGQVLGNRYR